jgi:hypothetical protein
MKIPAEKFKHELFNSVQEVFDLNYSQLASASRLGYLTLVRHLCMNLMREYTTLSTPMIAATFNRDHATVIHANKRHLLKDNPRADKNYHDAYINLMKSLSPKLMLLLTGNVPVLNLTIMGYDLQKLINLRNFFSDIGDKNNVSMMNIYIEQFRNIEREALALEYVN